MVNCKGAFTMKDYVFPQGMKAFLEYLANLKPEQLKSFVLVTPHNITDSDWATINQYVMEAHPAITVLETDQETGLIKIRCTAEPLRILLQQPDMVSKLIAINNDMSN
jgi:hypothetical protein